MVETKPNRNQALNKRHQLRIGRAYSSCNQRRLKLKSKSCGTQIQVPLITCCSRGIGLGIVCHFQRTRVELELDENYLQKKGLRTLKCERQIQNELST